MIYGFVMVQCNTGLEKNVYERLKTFDWVEELHPLFGEFDFILRVKADDSNHLAKHIIEEIRSIDGINHTKTFLEASFGPDSLETKG